MRTVAWPFSIERGCATLCRSPAAPGCAGGLLGLISMNAAGPAPWSLGAICGRSGAAWLAADARPLLVMAGAAILVATAQAIATPHDPALRPGRAAARIAGMLAGMDLAHGVVAWMAYPPVVLPMAVNWIVMAAGMAAGDLAIDVALQRLSFARQDIAR